MRNSSLKTLCCLASFIAVAFATMFVQGEETADESSSWVAKRTAYLKDALEGAHRMTIVGRLGGKGQLTLDPNKCVLDKFGDPTICTQIALAHYFVSLKETGISDPTGADRQLFEIVAPSSQHPLPLANRLYLVVPRSSSGAFRLVSADRSAPRRVVTLESVRVEDKTSTSFVFGKEGGGGAQCQSIDFTSVRIAPGIVNGTWILIVQGNAPCLNMDVRLVPRVYVRQPDYWGIEVIGCLPCGQACFRGVKPYVEAIPLDGITGKYGVEVIGRKNSQQLKVPPK